MRLVAHGLGCSILTVAGMDDPNFTLDGNFKVESVNVMRPDGKGFSKLKTWLKNKNRAGILVWVDNTTTDDDDVGYFDDRDTSDTKTYVCSGKKFYKMLEARGEHVEKTNSYKNPGHDGRCSVYWWYFRKRPKARASGASASNSGGPTKETRGKAVAKKTKATTRRVAA